MRISVIVVVLGILLLAGQSGAQQGKQGKGKDANKVGPAKGSAETSPEMYGGKTLDQWRAEMKGPDASKRNEAMMAVLSFGPKVAGKAVPDILQRLQDRDVGTRTNACIALRYVEVEGDQISRVVNALATRISPQYESQASIRYHAAVTLLHYVPHAGPVTSKVLVGLRDTSSYEMRQVCTSILWRIGVQGTGKEGKDGPDPAIVQGFLDWIRNEYVYQVRLELLQGLGWMGKPADKALQARLVSDLTTFASSERTPRTLSIWAYAALVSHGDVAVSKKSLGRIAGYLNYKDISPKSHNATDVKIQALLALGALGNRAKNHVPDVLKLLKEEKANTLIVQAACSALHRMGDSSDTVVSILIELVEHKDTRVAASAVKAIVDMKLKNERVFKTLDRLLVSKPDPALYAWVQAAVKELRK
jgi:HEAT repeat protein